MTFILTLLLLTNPAQASVWSRVCGLIVADDPHQFEELPSGYLTRLYLAEGAKVAWAKKKSTLLTVMGNQLRRNHLREPLPNETLRILEDYEMFEERK